MAMVFQSVYYLNGGEGSRKSKRFYMGFSATLLALITIALACNVRASHTLLDPLELTPNLTRYSSVSQPFRSFVFMCNPMF